MDTVVANVECIQSLPDTFVDVGLGQGRDALLSQIRKRYEIDEIAHLYDGTETIDEFEKDIPEVKAWVFPLQLPDDYLFFLDYYGGLAIENEPELYKFRIYGIGPMSDEWYGYLMGDFGGKKRYGFLEIGALVTYDNLGKRIMFLLDLAGTIQPFCVISIPEEPFQEYVEALENPPAHPDRWIKEADSFTEWLGRIADTQGKFGYL